MEMFEKINSNFRKNNNPRFHLSFIPFIPSGAGCCEQISAGSALSHEKFKFILWPKLQFHSAFSCEWMRFLSSQAQKKAERNESMAASSGTYEYFMNGKGKVSYSQEPARSSWRWIVWRTTTANSVVKKRSLRWPIVAISISVSHFTSQRKTRGRRNKTTSRT